MNDTQLKLTEQIKREELRIKRNKNIKKAIMGFIIIFIFFIIANKAYDSYRQKLYHEKRTILSQNEKILREFNNYLWYVNGIITDLIFDQEIEKEFVRGSLSGMRQSIDNLYYVRYDSQKYKIDGIRDNNFFYDSEYSINILLKKDLISPLEKELLARIYKVNQEIIDTYSKHIKRSYHKNNSEEIRYRLYYEGEMLYHLLNTFYASSDGVDINIEKEHLNVSKDYIAERLNQLQRSISDDKALFLSNQIYQVIFDRDAKLEETGYTSENFNTNTGEGEHFKNNLGQHTTSITYSAEDFDENEYIRIHITTEDKTIVYFNNGYSTKKDISETEIDKIADEIISRLNCGLLTLVYKSKNRMEVANSNKSSDVLEYSYSLKDETYYDETSYVHIYMYKDGTVRGLIIGDYSLLDGTYEKIIAKITPNEAIKALDTDSQNNIKSVILVKSREPYYKIVFNKYGIDFTASVNAQSGKLNNITGP